MKCCGKTKQERETGNRKWRAEIPGKAVREVLPSRSLRVRAPVIWVEPGTEHRSLLRAWQRGHCGEGPAE